MEGQSVIDFCEKSSLSVQQYHGLVGNSAAMQHLRHLINQVADKNVNVLILGESGTGKEVVARALHQSSNRHNKPFVPVNCGAIPADLLESEIFGHEKGAFTGAISARKGRFELALKGSIFLDEIGDMPLSMQVKLLRVIQERCFERVGSNKSIEADARIIAATHRNLEQSISAGKFREDLYFRLNVFPIEIPALRNRIEDLPILIDDLVAEIGARQQCTIRFTQDALDSLAGYHWPGNVRELANLIERMMVLLPNGIINSNDLPAKYHFEQSTAVTVEPPVAVENTVQVQAIQHGIDLKQHLMDTESAYIRQALEACDGIVAHAANYLKVRRTTLVEKMRKYGITRQECEELV